MREATMERAMHGLINRAIEGFVRDSYGRDTWGRLTRRLALGVAEFEAMLHYDDALTAKLLDGVAEQLGKQRHEVLEDIGTYLVSHPNAEALRRLLRFGGGTFGEFLQSLDDLPARARLAVPDLEVPRLELREHAPDHFSLSVQAPTAAMPPLGHVMIGLLRALADDYGTLVLLEHRGRRATEEIVEIRLLEPDHAAGRDFDLGARAG
ncbi:MAG: heme NO-binding domain-containing protein [Roseovarius sp.]|nr:heme NO-binding domain-containing protein [Roseovarius sp.]